MQMNQGAAWLSAPELHHSHLFPSEEMKGAFALMGDVQKLSCFIFVAPFCCSLGFYNL